MKWSNVRNIYPNRWVLVEALATHSNNHQRTIEEMSIVSEYDDPKDAWASYKKLHLSEPTRELYIFYTGNEYIEVIEQSFTGIKGLR
ncbi:hypothetical protein [Paenibacillus cellulositrophicus]|uniref:hypothetical protein n=1 Tax=Paenibacillus cellulositrophicus TaxID=562959 RepID=UPI0012671D94|nr:hypothetical protein [Paenibacillus cellulositrophicus]